MEKCREMRQEQRRRWDDLTRKNRQDKEVGINPDFDGAEAGNPLCNACGEEVIKKPRGRPVKVGVEKHIRITDGIMTERINELIAVPQYGNFNKVINDALFYGLPVLYEKVFGDSLADTEFSEKEKTDGNATDEEFNAVVIRLLREIVLNATINKSILSSLFNERSYELEGKSRKSNFESGIMSDTPDYLSRYEVEGIKSLRR